MNARNGKIARLPFPVREALNERLEQCAQSPELLAWLNALPEVRSILRAHFDSAPINKVNLSRWRTGGFQEWLARRDLFGPARRTAELSRELDEDCAPRTVADNLATALAARFAGLLVRWNGQVDKTFSAKARILNGLCGSVVRLQRETHHANRRNADPLPEELRSVTVDNGNGSGKTVQSPS